MGRRSEERERRKALSAEKFEAAKAALIARVVIEQQPKVLVEPIERAQPRLAPHLARAADAAEMGKNPKAIKDGSRFACKVTWCANKADREGKWSWGELRDWDNAEWDEVIQPPFRFFEQLTWGEIDSLSSESGHKMHHDHDLGDLVPEAQDRWRHMDLEQFDVLFRFRLGGTRRAWGYVAQAHFHLVWWERNHSIYPV